MFTIIIAIVAIAIIVAIILATQYSGGTDTMTKGKQQAEVAKSLNDLQQITAALYQFHADTGANATSLDDLVPKYLASIPQGWGVEVPSQVAFESTQLLTGSESQKLDSCTEINTKLGVTGAPPSCADIDAGFTGCCVVPDSTPS